MKTSVQSMDLAADLERIIQELEGGHGPDPYREVICEILGHIPNPPPPPPSPAGPGFNCHHQAVDIGDVSQQLLCGDSIMQADGGLYSQGQVGHSVRGGERFIKVVSIRLSEDNGGSFRPTKGHARSSHVFLWCSLWTVYEIINIALSLKIYSVSVNS